MQHFADKIFNVGKRNWLSDYVFPDNWVNRTVLASQMIDSSWDVIEFGAGSAKLKEFLKSSQRYLPTDLVLRQQSFQIINLDHPLQLKQEFDVGIAIGVLEYVNSLHFTLNQIATNLPNFVTTYCAAKNRFLKFERARGHIGWKNHLTKKEFENIINQVGYKIQVVKEIETRFFYNQYIYKLQKLND